MADVRTTLARWLEEGSLSGRASRAAARGYATFADRAIVRPLRVPARADGRRPLLTVTVGGATLGGSGKTRVALACANELASHGVEVVLVGHAYRAAPRMARVVLATDSRDDVGDEALACARVVAGGGMRVRIVVGPSRQAAIVLASALVPRVDVVVVDGPLQLSPLRASLSILALDAEAPWGAGALPPAGDLRASPEALIAHADEIVHVAALPSHVRVGDAAPIDLGAFESSLRAAPVRPRLGLFTALARPDRLVRALAKAGLSPDELVRAPDHGPLTAENARRLEGAGVDLWLATGKCAVHLEGAPRCGSLAILDGSLTLPPSTVAALRRLIDGLACDPHPHACLDPSIRKVLLSTHGT